MTKDIELFTSATGFTVSSPNTITVESFPEYIAGINSTSLLFHFDHTAGTKYITKTGLNIDVTGYNEIVLHTRSFNLGSSHYLQASDFNYKLKLASGYEYYLPALDRFCDVTIDITGLTAITEITITYLNTTKDDDLIISNMIATKDDMPFDIFTGLKNQLSYIIGLDAPNGIATGSTVTCLTGDTKINPAGNRDWLERYAYIKITDGTHTENHQIQDIDSTGISFTPLYDGVAMLHDYTSAVVWLNIPIEFGKVREEITLPGIVVWGVNPEPINRGSKLEKRLDTFKASTNTMQELSDGQITQWPLLIDCEARQYELLNKISYWVRHCISQEKIWINGRKHDVAFEGNPIEAFPNEFVDLIPKIQYTVKVELKEAIYPRVTLYKINNTTVTNTPEASL
jgi:hypothetical protein